MTTLGREAVAVRTDTIFPGQEGVHEHVIALKLDDGAVLYLGEVVEAIDRGEAIHMQGEPVVVRACPDCGASPTLFAAVPK